MQGRTACPTPYPDVNVVLFRLLSDVQAILGEWFVGLYVCGSLAGGDFEPGRSDVDFLVVTAGELPGNLLPALAVMHARLVASGLAWADKLEGPYIPQQALRRYDPGNARHPALRVDGSFDVDWHTSDWIIQRHAIRERGIALAGPPPHVLIDPVAPDDLRRAAGDILGEWWLPQLDDHARLRSDEYQVYAVLTMCRSLYTLQYGDVVSKPVAARWVQTTALGERWAALIDEALVWRHNMPFAHLDETLDLIRFTLECAQQIE